MKKIQKGEEKKKNALRKSESYPTNCYLVSLELRRNKKKNERKGLY